MLHHPHPLTDLAVKVIDFEILRWSFWLKVFRIGYPLNLWMDLVDTIPDVRYWSKILPCSIPTPHLLTDLEVKVTDLEFFMINEISISHISQSSESIHLSNIRTLEGLLPFHNYWPNYSHGVGLEVKNIEHPHTLAILSSFFWLQMHFSFIGKAQFRWAKLFWDSSYVGFVMLGLI